MSSLVSVKNLKVEFHTKDLFVEAVRGISFDIKKKETLGLVGESGSGKSVTALSIMNLVPQPPGNIASGEITLDNKNLLDLRENEMCKIRGNRISMIFQEPMTSLNPVFTVGNQIDEALILHQNMSKEMANKASIDLLDQVGIHNPSERVKSYPHELSGGQRQRVMIAMAIACKPDLLIADEPTTALDVTVQKQILELLQNLKENFDMSMLFVSHDLGIIAEICDRVLVMNKGEIVESGLVTDVYKKPKNPYTKGLLACRPSLDVSTDRLPTVSDFLEGKRVDIDEADTSNQKKDRASSDENYLIEVKNLKKYFPLKKNFFGQAVSWIKAVDDASFSIRKGSTLGLVGESGSGKTTLGRAILRLIEPSMGSIIYDHIPLIELNKKELKKMRCKMQIIFQDPYASLNPRMTVGDSIMEPLIIHNLYPSREERLLKIESLMEQVGLEKTMLNRYPHEFSGGQRQRICIARALAVKPEFLVCDESVSALDVSVQAQILNLLKDLQEELNLTYLFISHDLAVIKFFSDQVAVMNSGKIVEINDSDKIYKNPQNEYTKKLIDAIPLGIPKELAL